MVAMKKHLLIIALLMCASRPLLAEAPPVDRAQRRRGDGEGIRQRFHAREPWAVGIRGSREYILENNRMDKRAEMQVTVSCDPDGTKHFEVISEDGWKSPTSMYCIRCWIRRPKHRTQIAAPRHRMSPWELRVQPCGSETTSTAGWHTSLELFPSAVTSICFADVCGSMRRTMRSCGSRANQPRPRHSGSTALISLRNTRRVARSGIRASTTSVTDARIFGITAVDIRYFDYRPVAAYHQQQSNSKPLEAHYVQH